MPSNNTPTETLKQENFGQKILSTDKINHKKKLVHIFTPKCGSMSVSNYLNDIDPNFDEDWEIFPDFLDIPEDYTSFAVIRNPLDWLISGFKMFTQKNLIKFDFDTHCKIFHNPLMLLGNGWKDYGFPDKTRFDQYWWHCIKIPSDHLKDDTKVFKIEEIGDKKLQNFLSEYYPNALQVDFPHINASAPSQVSISKDTYQKIKSKLNRYAQNNNYSWNFDDQDLLVYDQSASLKNKREWLLDNEKGIVYFDTSNSTESGWWNRIPHGVDRNHSDVKIKS